MIYNVWIRALSESLESICLGSWELKRDLNTLPLHVRHGVWNHGPLEWCHNESAMAPEITGVSIVCLAVRSTLRVSGEIHHFMTSSCDSDNLLFVLMILQTVNKWNLKVRIRGSLWGEYTGEQWILPTKGQWYEKVLDVMTPSWVEKLGISHDPCSHFLSVGNVLCRCNYYAT